MPTAALTCRPWAGSLRLNRLFHLREPLTMATSTPNRNLATPRTACTTRITTFAALTALSRITTTPTSSGWATRCGLLLCNRPAALILCNHDGRVFEPTILVFLGTVYISIPIPVSLQKKYIVFSAGVSSRVLGVFMVICGFGRVSAALSLVVVVVFWGFRLYFQISLFFLLQSSPIFVPSSGR